MRISPLDIRQQQFTVRLFRGFETQEVDAFLDDVAEDYEAVLKENALLKEQLATFEMKAAARREAELYTREAELRGEKLLEEVRSEEAKLRGEVQGLRRTRRQLIEDLRSTLESYYRLMSAEFGDDAGAAGPKG